MKSALLLFALAAPAAAVFQPETKAQLSEAIGLCTGDMTTCRVSAGADGTPQLSETGTLIENWDVSDITDMKLVFASQTNANPDLSKWDVSNVVDMSYMFWSASAFTGDLSTWDVGMVTTMGSMFYNAAAFNGDLSAWNVGKVTSMSMMFRVASAFDSDLSAWDVSRVTNMGYMFYKASAFDQQLCGQAWVDSSDGSVTQTKMFEGTDGSSIATVACSICFKGEHYTGTGCAFCPNGESSVFGKFYASASATQCISCGDGEWSAPSDGKGACADRIDFTLRQLGDTACAGKIDPSECDFSTADSGALADAVQADATAYQMAGLCN